MTYGACHIRNNVSRRNNVQDWDREGLRRSHLAVRFQVGGELFVWDSDGAVKGGRKFGLDGASEPRYECWAPFGKGMQVRECGAIAGVQHGAWNSSFDREQIPTMQRLVSQFL